MGRRGVALEGGWVHNSGPALPSLSRLGGSEALPEPPFRDSRAPLPTGSRMEITPDTMLVVLQALPFFTAVAGLHFILFKPMLAYLQARRAATVGERQAAEALKEQAGRKLQQWDVALGRAHAEVADFRAQKRSEAQAEYGRQVASARALAERHIAEQLAVLQGEAATARAEVGRMARGIASDMAASTLGRPLAAVEA